MAFMDWVLDVAAKHPELQGAFISEDGDWLDVLLADGRALRFRPGQMIDETAPAEKREAILNRLISIGVTMAKPADSQEASANSADETGPADSSADYEKRSDATFGPQVGRASGFLWGGIGRNDDVVDAYEEDELEDKPPTILPIVRPADYFVSSHRHAPTGTATLVCWHQTRR